MDLFDYNISQSNSTPLAERMRPSNLDELLGQEHIIARGKLLRKLIETDNIPSMILQGPPASGKTSLAFLISKMTKAEFVKLNAAALTVSELRSVLVQARDNLRYYRKKTIVFIDEIHALKANVQMTLLADVENGTAVLIGATTESVAHEIIPPLASRCQIYNLRFLSKSDIIKLLTSALQDQERGFGQKNLSLEQEAAEYLAAICNGDARNALNSLEIAAFSTEPGTAISLDIIQQACQQQYKGITTTEYYDLISAFIKSMRAGHTDGALYWLARMLQAGVDPLFIARRIVIQAAEDVGLANPHALQLAVAAKEAAEFLGMPEARIPLAEAVIYICESPKSNSAYKAISQALNLAKGTSSYAVPNHLKNSTGQYVNPLDNPGTKLEYLPQELQNSKFYDPQNSGFEQKIHTKYHPE
ncbi:MAG TPA: replication-associated recombination protein A [Desulfitobacteriaceae bacterium]|nr:replication-associated recombination protein A [Desulfitobacteriaceae bacterium]